MNASLDLPGDGNRKKCAEKKPRHYFFGNAAALNVNLNGNMRDGIIQKRCHHNGRRLVLLRRDCNPPIIYIIPAFACKSRKEGFANE